MPDFVAEITDEKAPSVKVVHLNGELDEISVEQLKTQLDSLLEDTNVNQLIFDLTNLRFINSKGIGFLVSVNTDLSKDGRNMTLAGANESVMDVLSLVGLTNIIPYHATLEEALA